MLFDTLGKIFRAAIDDREKVKLAQEAVESEDNVLVGKMLKRRPRLDPAKMQWFSEEQSVSLAKAHSNAEIWNRGGRGLFITKMDGTPATTLIRFNDIAGPTYEARPGYIKGAFQRIYLTNAAETGKTLKFVVGYRNFAEFMLLDPATDTTLGAILVEIGKLPNKSTSALVPLTVALTLADTEYFVTIPADTKQFKVHGRSGAAIRIACLTGKVAGPIEPYWTIAATDPPFEVKGLDMVSSFPLYIASPEATKYAEVVCWK